jgi:hypothetical protein
LRFWFEVALASASALLGFLTLAWPDWIEAVLGVDPDHHSGAAEWIVVAVCVGLAAASSFGARVELRRPRGAVLLPEE